MRNSLPLRLVAAILLTLLFGLSSTAPAWGLSLTEDRMKGMEEAVHQTGVTRDQIPSIEQPRYVGVPNASLVLDREDIVFVWESPDGVYVYPREIMLWHQVLNDMVADRRVSVTHDPVTGCLVGYSGELDKVRTSFGVYGPLLNNNLLLYDRASASVWPQAMGLAFMGRLKGRELKPFPLLWSTWGRVKERYPKARVLARPTVGNFLYGRDPYGSYGRKDTYYQNRQIVYPLQYPLDARLHPKEPVLGIVMGEDQTAVAVRAVVRQRAVNFRLGITPLVALYDEQLDAVRVFRPLSGARKLTLTPMDKEYQDEETGSFWSAEGKCESGPLRDAQLERIPTWRAMWFVWSQFHQGSGLVAGEEEQSVGDLLP